MTKREIYKAFEGKLVGKYFMKRMICDVVVKLPNDMQEFVTKKCWFLSSMEDAWAYAFTGNDLRDQHLIFLSDELFYEDKESIYYSIAHEIGHILLKHRNSVLFQQSKEEVAQQEREADAFAREVLNF